MDRKEELMNRVQNILKGSVEAALKTKTEHQQRRKCSECGKGYLGQKNSSTCGDKCRQRKSRG